MAIETLNPASGELVASFPELSAQEIQDKLSKAQDTFQSWSQAEMSDRSVLMHRAAEILRSRKTEYGALMTLEMGKPLVDGEAEAEKCAWVCDYYADEAPGFLKPESVETDAGSSYVRFDPLGPVLAVMPWNFPFWQVFRFAAPALMAGNVGLLKHASNVPACALAIEETLRDAGFPEGTFQTLLIGSGAVEQVIDSPHVKAVTLTGSEPAGMAVASRAGATIKKTVLELGGSDPFIVLDDADILETAASAATARCINTGQSCIAAKRFIVQESVADSFSEQMAAEMKKLTVGDPMDRATRIGPLARADLVHDLEKQVKESVALGARLVMGGKRIDRPGCFYEPTILDHVTKGMAAYEEETFGPVAAIIRVRDDEEAIAVANDSRFGLGASVWSGNTQRAEALAPRIESGAVFINGIVKSDPRLPFGGVRYSGYGRELSSYGIREFVNIKSVWVR